MTCQLNNRNVLCIAFRAGAMCYSSSLFFSSFTSVAMSASREMSTTRHRLDTSSQSSDEFLQQFPAPPVPQHFSAMDAIDNNGNHRLNEKTYPDSAAPTLSKYYMHSRVAVI